MIRLAVRVPRAQAEIVLAELLELAPNGVEETDMGDRIEYAVYGSPGELPALPGKLRIPAGAGMLEVVSEEIPDDWTDSWKDFHKPVDVGGRLHVRPPWEKPRDDRIDVVIDPGQAFGTGSHATTRGCLEFLLAVPPGGVLADIGCGTGVLAIAAAKLGWDPVWAGDYETLALQAADANAAANGVTLDWTLFDVTKETPPAARTITANLLRPLTLQLADRLKQPPEHLVLGGLLEPETDEIVAAFEPHGLSLEDRTVDGEWVSLLLARS